MSWIPLTAILKKNIAAHRLTAAVGSAALIEAFNSAAGVRFNDPMNQLVRCLSYHRSEMTVYCRSPVYAAAVREHSKELIDPIRKLFPTLPVTALNFRFRKPESL